MRERVRESRSEVNSNSATAEFTPPDRKRLPDLSRTTLKRLIDAGHLLPMSKERPLALGRVSRTSEEMKNNSLNGLDHVPTFPKRIPEKLKAIRERFGFTPDEIAVKVGAKTGAEITAYENDTGDLLVSVLWRYAQLADVPVENILHDDRDLWFGHRINYFRKQGNGE